MFKKEPKIFKKFFKYLLFFGFVAFFVLVFFAYNLFLLNRIYPGVKFAGVLISYASANDTKSYINNRISHYKSVPITLKLTNDIYEVSLEELGIEISEEKSYLKVFQAGRNNFFHIFPLVNKHEIEPIYIVNFSEFNKKVDEIFTVKEHKAKNANIDYVKGEFIIISEKEGVVVDRDKLILDIKSNISDLSNSLITVNMLADLPKIYSTNLENVLMQATSLNNKKIVLKHLYDSWSLSGQKLAAIVSIEQENHTKLAFSFFHYPIELESKEMGQNSVSLTFDQHMLKAFIDDIGKSIDRQKIDASLKFEDGKVLEFNSARDGQSLDRVKLYDLISSALVTSVKTDTNTISIELPVKIERAKIDNAEINSLGIKELIGSGVSYFAGSIPNRVHNVSLGSQLITGTLIKPGDVFSFTSLVGPVNAQQGFKQAYVISSGRTVLDDGGGICQVSTTVFRAALNSGLPILKRTAHAYRVSYYEQNGFKPGMDATIWSPSVDLQFKNDTSHHILLQATVDKSKSKIQVDLYGTRDGRRVELGETIVSNISAPPPALYQDDPTLPKGVTKQVDFSAAGASAVFTRKVYKGNTLTIDESFKSNYKPWQAVFLVGTGG